MYRIYIEDKRSKIIAFKTFKLVFFLYAALFLVMAGCGPDPFFIPVASINGVPDTGAAGTPLPITGTVSPSFASNSSIIWLVVNAGTTGAGINGNILNASTSGTVIINAKIINGIAEGMDYTQDFIIVIRNIVAITVNSPVLGKTPDLSASGTGKFTISDVSWTPDDGVFKYNTKYTVKVALKAVNDYSFAVLDSATINGKKADVSDNSGTAVTLSYTFDEINYNSNENIITNTEDLQALLEMLPANTYSTPYTIKQIINNTSDFEDLKATLDNAENKYVYLDISNSTITNIPDGAFCDLEGLKGCTTLTGITLPNTIDSIGYRAFENCFNLATIAIPDNVISIGELAFADCGNLTDVTIGINVKKIENQAFYYCLGLTSITIPDSVTEIGDSAFNGCDTLNSVKFEGNNIIFGFDSFYGDLQTKFLAEGKGKYTTSNPGYEAVWRKE
jgi:hypothetical protein